MRSNYVKAVFKGEPGSGPFEVGVLYVLRIVSPSIRNHLNNENIILETGLGDHQCKYHNLNDYLQDWEVENETN